MILGNNVFAVRIRLQRQVICPHCWHEFSPESALWVAQHSELVGDPRLGEDQQMRFLPSRFNVKGDAIDARGFPCTSLACPRCHLEVPRAFFELPALFWSILGAPACGKSYLLASMTWQLRKILPKYFALSFSDIDPTSNRTVNEYEEQLFLSPEPDKLTAIRKTELQGDLYDTVLYSDQTVSYPRPFVFSIKPTRDHPHLDRVRKLGKVLCLYDNAGEHFLPGQDTVGSPVTRHLAQSRVLLFLFDPTQDPRFREACQGYSEDPQLRESTRTSRQESILHEAADRVRRLTGLSQLERHHRPLVVIVTKADVWLPLLSRHNLREPIVRGNRENWGALQTAYVEEVSQKVRDLLWRHSPEIVSAAEGFAEQVAYIPVSATGTAPQLDPKTGLLGIRPKDIRPVWAEVPVLYALCRWLRGAIPRWDGETTTPAEEPRAKDPYWPPADSSAKRDRA
jgi:hypothetical protein